MKRNTLKWEAVSRIDSVILEKEHITREEISNIYETVYSIKCNRFMNMCGGRNEGYLRWLHEEVGVFIRKVKDPVTSDDNGKIKYIRRWGYDDMIDAYVFTGTKIKKESQLAPARRANIAKAELGKIITDKAVDEKELIDEHELKIQKENEFRAWDNANPSLFEEEENVR